ncbi:MAG: beta-propeller domain-containing protein [Halobacteriota archaeon]
MTNRASSTATTMAGLALAALVVGAAVGAGAMAVLDGGVDAAPLPKEPTPHDGDTGESAGVSVFSSADEFRAYLDAGSQSSAGGMSGFAVGGGVVAEERAVAVPQAATPTSGTSGGAVTGGGGVGDGSGSGGAGSATGEGAETVTRHSTTNVQVAGIDEPDLVKTDGETTAYSRALGYTPAYYPNKYGQTLVVNTSSPAAPEVASSVDASGQLLLYTDTMVVLSNERIVAYDIADREDPKQRWETSPSGRIVTVRKANGMLYLVTSEGVDYEDPCPVRPLGPEGASVPCDAVYHPSEPLPADTTYTAMVLDPADGDVTNATSFVGARQYSSTYVSSNAIYLTYTEYSDGGDRYVDFLLTEERDVLPQTVVDRLEELQTYNLSPQTRQIEARYALSGWYRTLDADERQRVQTRLNNDWRNYLEDHKRDLVTTGVVKVGLGERSDPSLSVEAVGTVPGRPLNQFSMDEHEGHLRIATTVGSRGTEPENDVYVLDGNLSVVGSVTGMGVDEQIFSVRFVGDEGYVVTFRQIDPFHVLDLSDPENPTLEGELKLPGFSSYLHPLDEDRILGIGEEDGEVKAVVFDVSDPGTPTIEDDYVLDDHWSAVSQSHHAFLLDEKHGVFFLPGSEGGYVFNYRDGLELETVVSTAQPRRAVYLDDYLYVFSDREVVVVDENSWDRVTTLDLPEPAPADPPTDPEEPTDRTGEPAPSREE